MSRRRANFGFFRSSRGWRRNPKKTTRVLFYLLAILVAGAVRLFGLRTEKELRSLLQI